MKRLICFALALLLLTGAALADVELTEQANLREYAGEGYKTLVTLPAGSVLDFVGYVEMDSEGVYWYNVNFRDELSWVSSRQARLTGQIGNGMELSFYLGHKLSSAVGELGRGESAGDIWYNDNACVWADENGYVDSFLVYGNEYTIYDCMAGMDLATVLEMYQQRGLALLSQEEGWYTFGHYGMNSAGYRVNAFDAIVTVVENSEAPGVVSEIELDPYRG